MNEFLNKQEKQTNKQKNRQRDGQTDFVNENDYTGDNDPD